MRKLRVISIMLCFVFIIGCIYPISVQAAEYSNIYNGVDYSEVFDAEYYLNSYSDLKNAFGNNSAAALSHFVNNGMREGRVGRAEFNPWYYKSQYVDLQKAFGNDMTLYYIHFKNSGIVEGRRGSEIYDPYSYLGYNQSLYDMFHYDFKSLYN